jgi:cyclic pyranopterin phosphate synthase
MPTFNLTQRQPWRRVPVILLPSTSVTFQNRLFSTSLLIHAKQTSTPDPAFVPPKQTLTHLTTTGTAHMVSIASKVPTSRTATATCSVNFSNAIALNLIHENGNKKGDVLGVARIAGIMAAKRTPDLIPLCHPIAITHVLVDIEIVDAVNGTVQVVGEQKEEQMSMPWAGTGQGDAYAKKWSKSSSGIPLIDNSIKENGQPRYGKVEITATVSCDGKTGVEMEALTAASTAALTVYDMCKSVDKGMRIEGLRVTRKEGGKSGTWVEGISSAS